MVVDINEVNSFTQTVKEVGEGVEVPIPDVSDSGKVLIAGDDGSVSWESGGGGIEVFEFDLQEYKINKSYNQLLSYMNDGKLVMGVMTFEDDSNTFTVAYILTQLIRVPNDNVVTYEARLGSISYNDGGGRAESIPLVAEDPDIPMIIDV